MSSVHPEIDARSAALRALVEARYSDPFAVLGPHRDTAGTVIRAFQPSARMMEVRLIEPRELRPMVRVDPAGLYEVRLPPGPAADSSPDYRLRITFPGDLVSEIDDAYRYGRVLADFDLHLFAEGTHRRAYDKLGSHRIRVGSTTGVHFAVWAPNAERVSVIGDFNGWDGRVHPMRALWPSGVWEIFIPDLADGQKYKFEIRARGGRILRKSDPYAVAFEVPPQSASVVRDISGYQWRDEHWMATRAERNRWFDRPMAVYE